MAPDSLPTPVLLFFLPILLSLCDQVHGSNSCVQTLPNASDIHALARDNKNQLVAPFRELRIFPNITFGCYGSIVGWRLAAVNNTGFARPELSVWRSNGTNQYVKVAASRINPSVISDNVGRLDTATVMIHENIINQPIPFEPGYILGILFRRRPRYIPLLYNVTSSGDCEGLVSFYRQTGRSPPDDAIMLTSDISRDSLFPLISLEIYSSTSNTTPPTASLCLIDTPPTLPYDRTDNSPARGPPAGAIAGAVVGVMLVVVAVLVVLLVVLVLRRRKKKKLCAVITEERVLDNTAASRRKLRVTYPEEGYCLPELPEEVRKRGEESKTRAYQALGSIDYCSVYSKIHKQQTPTVERGDHMYAVIDSTRLEPLSQYTGLDVANS